MPTSYSWVLVTPTVVTPDPPTVTISVGEDGETGYSIIRRHLNRFFSGPNWDAVIAALGEADDYIFALARNAIAQFTESTASGTGLDVLGGNQAVVRPWAAGMPDDQYRKLLVALNHNKVTYQAVLEVLEALYGMDNLRAYVDIPNAPWALVDGQVLTFDFGGAIHSFRIDAAQFPTLGAVTPLQLGIALADWFALIGVDVPIAHTSDAIRIYSPARGVQSVVAVTGFGVDPVRFTGRVRAVQPGNGRLSITVPAVAPSTRTDGDASVGGSALGVLTLVRRDGQLLVETSAPHGLTAGDKIELTGFVPAEGRAWTQPSTATTTMASHTHTIESLWASANPVGDNAIPIALSTGDALFVSPNLTSARFGLASSTLAASPNHSDRSTIGTFTQSAATPAFQHVDGAGSALIGPYAGYALVTGGDTGSKQTELYNGTSWSTVANMLSGRDHHAQVTLPNGDVLVVGGTGTDCERYSPTANHWYSVDSIVHGNRESCSAALLATGKVLLVGGNGARECELFDPATNTWSGTAPISAEGAGNDFLFLLNGGAEAVFVPWYSPNPASPRPVEVYTAATGLWRKVAAVPTDAQFDAAALSGRHIVLFAIGQVRVLDTATWRWVGTHGIGFQRNTAAAVGDFVLAGGDDTSSLSIFGGNNATQRSRGVNSVHAVESVTSSTTFTIASEDLTFTAMHSALSASATRVGSTVTVTASIPNVGQVWVNSSNASFAGGLKTVTGRTSTTFTYTEAGAATTGTISVGTTLATPTLHKPVTSDQTGFVVGNSALTASTALTRSAETIIKDILSPHVDLSFVKQTPGTNGLGRGDQNWK